MTDLRQLAAANSARWDACHIIPALQPAIADAAAHLLAAKARYQAVELKTGVPWWVISVIHLREASQSWAGSLAQGDPWDKPSIHVPRDRGPFNSWEAAAIDALQICPPHAANWTDWSIGGALCLLEQYNGLGYAQKGLPSPYLWASTDQYSRGKYIQDGHFDPNAIDRQMGCAALIKAMGA